MVIAIDGTTPARVGVETGDAVTASFTAPSGAVLLAVVDAGSTGASAPTGPQVSDSGGLSWSLVDSHFSPGYSQVAAWVAVVPSATARTVTLHCDTNTLAKFLQVMVLTGADISTPLGNVTKGLVASGVLSASVVCSVTGSMLFAVYADWATLAAPTPAAGTTLQSSYGPITETAAALYKTAAGTSGAAMTVATSAPTTAKITYLAAEIRIAAAGGGGAFVPQVVMF